MKFLLSTRTRADQLLGLMTVGLLLFICHAGPAHAQNFYALAGQKGCESVMPSLRDECQKLSAAKDRACEDKGECDFDRHQAQVVDYKTDKERIDKGEVNNADIDSVKANVEHMKAELDARKSSAEAIERAARSCADARELVFEFFKNKVIPDTDKASAEAASRKKTLIEELDKAEVLQRSAKDRRDELADADPEKDRARWEEYVRMKDEYDRSAEAYRQAETNLGQFNSAYGDDPAEGAKRLLDNYRSEQEGHHVAIEQQRARAESCGKVKDMSY